MGHRRSAAAHRVGNEGPLDDAVLVGHVRTRRIGRDDAGAGNGTEVKFDPSRLGEHLAAGVVGVTQVCSGHSQRRIRRRVENGLYLCGSQGHGRHERRRAVVDLRDFDARLAQLFQALRGLFNEAAHGSSLQTGSSGTW